MKNENHYFFHLLLITFLALSITGCGSNTTKQDPEFTSIYDGKTFTGWEGNLDMFRIEDGAIVGGTLDEVLPNNEFLCTKVRYDDFELRLKAKMAGDDENEILNGGIQFRSERIPNNHEVIGYQCDMGEDLDGKIWGYLYDESRRREFLAKPKEADMLKVLKKGDWNDFRIRAEGDNVQIWLNDFQTVDYFESNDSIPRTGIICLQIHGGFPAEAWFKNIEIKEL